MRYLPFHGDESLEKPAQEPNMYHDHSLYESDSPFPQSRGEVIMRRFLKPWSEQQNADNEGVEFRLWNSPTGSVNLAKTPLPPRKPSWGTFCRPVSSQNPLPLAGIPAANPPKAAAIALRRVATEPNSFRGIQIVGYIIMFFILFLGPLVAIGLVGSRMNVPVGVAEEEEEEEEEEHVSEKEIEHCCETGEMEFEHGKAEGGHTASDRRVDREKVRSKVRVATEFPVSPHNHASFLEHCH
jgi:hypothetical protein